VIGDFAYGGRSSLTIVALGTSGRWITEEMGKRREKEERKRRLLLCEATTTEKVVQGKGKKGKKGKGKGKGKKGRKVGSGDGVSADDVTSGAIPPTTPTADAVSVVLASPSPAATATATVPSALHNNPKESPQESSPQESSPKKSSPPQQPDLCGCIVAEISLPDPPSTTFPSSSSSFDGGDATVPPTKDPASSSHNNNHGNNSDSHGRHSHHRSRRSSSSSSSSHNNNNNNNSSSSSSSSSSAVDDNVDGTGSSTTTTTQTQMDVRVDAFSGNKNIDKRRVHRTVTGIIGCPSFAATGVSDDGGGAGTTKDKTGAGLIATGICLVTLSDGAVYYHNPSSSSSSSSHNSSSFPPLLTHLPFYDQPWSLIDFPGQTPSGRTRATRPEGRIAVGRAGGEGLPVVVRFLKDGWGSCGGGCGGKESDLGVVVGGGGGGGAGGDNNNNNNNNANGNNLNATGSSAVMRTEVLRTGESTVGGERYWILPAGGMGSVPSSSPRGNANSSANASPKPREPRGNWGYKVPRYSSSRYSRRVNSSVDDNDDDNDDNDDESTIDKFALPYSDERYGWGQLPPPPPREPPGGGAPPPPPHTVGDNDASGG